MSLRQVQRRSREVLRDGGLLQAIRAELAHELSSSFSLSESNLVGRSIGGFKVEWDDPRTEDVFLRRNDGEEIAVSAKLGPLVFEGEDPLPRDARMKVCVKKHLAEPVMQFDCRVFRPEGSGSDFRISSVWYHPSVDSLVGSKYRGPKLRFLDPQLRRALKDYLEDRGVGAELTDFLLQHLHMKENRQYVNWLHMMEDLFAKY